MANLHRSGKLVILTAAAKAAKVYPTDSYLEILKYSTYRGKLQALPVSTNNLVLFSEQGPLHEGGSESEQAAADLGRPRRGEEYCCPRAESAGVRDS